MLTKFHFIGYWIMPSIVSNTNTNQTDTSTNAQFLTEEQYLYLVKYWTFKVYKRLFLDNSLMNFNFWQKQHLRFSCNKQNQPYVFATNKAITPQNLVCGFGWWMWSRFVGRIVLSIWSCRAVHWWRRCVLIVLLFVWFCPLVERRCTQHHQENSMSSPNYAILFHY